MPNFKLISLNISEVEAIDTSACAKSLLENLQSLDPKNEDAVNTFIHEVRQAGFPFTRLTIRRMISDGSLMEVLTSLEKETSAEAAKRFILEAIDQQIELVDIPNSSSRIMKREVTVALFKEVMQGYEIKGHNAKKLQAILDDPSKAEESLTYVNLSDAKEFAKRLSERTGRKFRALTMRDWSKAPKSKLLGYNLSWTESKFFIDKEVVLFRPGSRTTWFSYPIKRCKEYAIRLVEDLPRNKTREK